VYREEEIEIMTKNKLLWATLLSALVGVGAAAAQPGGPNHFAKLDTNADGVVTTPEFKAGALARFENADTNKDGKVTADEMKAAFAQHKHERKGEGKHMPGDADGDGVVTKTEAVAGAEEWAKKLDTNGDGKLTQDELSHFRGHHGRGHHGACEAQHDAD
jgi:EF-hand domain pair